MKYSVWSYYLREFSPEEQIGKYMDCGFRYAELSDEDGFILLDRGPGAKVGAELKKYADACGFSYPQGHLWLRANITADDYMDTVDKLKNWLDMYHALDIKAAVLHTGRNPDISPEEMDARRIKALTALTDYIKGTDITICLENLTNDLDHSGPILDLIDRVGSDHLGVCLDTGHLNLRPGESQYDFIRNCGSRLKALHIADNEGQTDQHMMPYGRGRVNWNDVICGLREIGYTGLFNLEIPGEANGPMEVKLAKLRYVHEICKYMTAQIGEEQT
ncbi:MAG: sugar phosphate isomerase/epimerase [Clostridia bacterium]|nr:sugar phosphate isomerase/epimerase [Clostridia bacterium]